MEERFPRLTLQNQITLPLRITNTQRSFNVLAKVSGGGVSGQAGSITHGIARALVKVDEAHRQPLRQAGLLTRDPRAKERKKPGLKRARKAPQYTKR
jgi:small subunit ribosomal protein S9